MLTRRRLLLAGGTAVAGGVATGLYAWRIEPHWVELTHRPLPVRGLPDRLHGKTLVQLSDIHVGRRVDDDYLRGCFDAVRALAPDLVVVTGDFISHRKGFERQAEPVYRQLPRGRLGTFGCLGNHDFGRHWAHPEVAAELQAILARHGLQLLRNETVEVLGLRLIGLEDFWTPTFDPAPTLARLPADAPALVLCHNPDAVDLPVWGGFRGWILAGHTHGGQCRPPFLPPPILPVRNRRYTAGPFALPEGRQLYINRGLGHLIRVRFNVRPEITVFTLTEAEA